MRKRFVQIEDMIRVGNETYADFYPQFFFVTANRFKKLAVIAFLHQQQIALSVI